MELEEVLKLFNFLAAPFNDTSNLEKSDAVADGTSTSNHSDVKSNTPDEILQSITDYCLQHVNFLESSNLLFNYDKENNQHYSSWKLTCVILSLLETLKNSIEIAEDRQTEEEKSIDVLSIQSQIIVQKSVEIVVGFGITPYLLPGVGVPEKFRKMNPYVPLFLSDVVETSHFEQFLRLSHVVEILLICSSNASLGALIIPNYSSDLLAGLLQICKSPIARPRPNTEAGKEGGLSEEQYDQVMVIRRRLELLLLHAFLENVPKSVLINSLFLIGASKRPRWIGTVCNDLLRNIMLSPNGLVVVASTMTESIGRFDTWKLMRIISNLMHVSLEKSDNPKCSDKLRSLSAQCILMVQQNQEHDNPTRSVSKDTVSGGIPDTEAVSLKLPYGTNVELMRIGLFCGITLLNVDFELVKSVFWDRLFYHLLQLEASQMNQTKVECSVAAKNPISPSNSEEIFITMRKVGMCATFGEVLLSVLKPINVSLPFKSLQPVWSLFLQIFVACGRYLKKPVQEPNIAMVAEQLYHKLKDVLIRLFEIYGSGLGETLDLSPSNNPAASTNSPIKNASSKTVNSDSKNIDLCEFTLMLLLNQETHSVPILNIFDLAMNGNEEICIIRAHQEMLSSTSEYNIVYEHYLNICCQYLTSEILKDDKLKGIWSPLLRQLLSWGTQRHNNRSRTSYAGREKRFKSDEMPNCLGGNNLKVSLLDCQRFVTFKLLGELGNEEAMLEQFASSKNVDETLGFLELLLNKVTEDVYTNADDEHGFDSSQLVMYALGIIGTISEAAATATDSSKTISNQFLASTLERELSGMWESLQVFIPHLRKLSQCTQTYMTRQGVPEMASSLLVSIGSRGVDNKRKIKKETIFVSRFQQAMEDACNPMVHIKGHGILELRRLIDEKDQEILENVIDVLNIFQLNISNDDSYVYLMSIQGMAALALKFHQRVVPTLIKEYDFVHCNDNVSGGDEANVNVNASFKESKARQSYTTLDLEERIEIRMKVGEILVKVIQKLGELAPIYRTPLTNVFFRLMRDDEPLIRASALSNLGELCHLLKFSLGIVLTEVWYCVESILNTEKDVHVRRAAVHLLVLLLKGVEKDMTAQDILSDNIIAQHLRDVRRYLSNFERTEVDLIAKTHCQLALTEMDFIVKKLLKPANSLSFKIQVLNI